MKTDRYRAFIGTIWAILTLLLLLNGCADNRDFIFITTDEAPDTSSHLTAPPESDSHDALTLVDLTETVSRGSKASVTIQGSPSIVYTIEVHYSTTISTAKGLEPKTADDNGTVSWTWTVGSRTKPGSYRIVIRGGGETITLSFTVTDMS